MFLKIVDSNFKFGGFFVYSFTMNTNRIKYDKKYSS